MVDLKNLGRKDKDATKGQAPDVPAPAASTENTPAASTAKTAAKAPAVDLAALAKQATDVADVGKTVRHRATKDTGPLPLETEVLATIDTGKAKAIPVPTLDVAKEVQNAVRRVGNRHDKGTKVRVYDVGPGKVTDATPDGILVQYRRDKDAKRYYWTTTDGKPYAGTGPFSVRFQATAERKHRTNGDKDKDAAPAESTAPSSEAIPAATG